MKQGVKQDRIKESDGRMWLDSAGSRQKSLEVSCEHGNEPCISISVGGILSFFVSFL
jgi:hypothetical protein